MVSKTNNGNSKIALMEVKKDTEAIRKDLQELKDNIEKHYVTEWEFDPIRKLVYGVVAIILTSVIVALVTLVVHKGGI